MLSKTEENYLKALLHLTVLQSNTIGVGTNELASSLNVKPATVSDMLKKLKEKGLVEYEKYGKITLTALGRADGMDVIRKHRLWETFLYDTLKFSWDEVHDVAEQLEHIKSKKLVNQLDEFLGYPKFDPHGDAIPDADGKIEVFFSKKLADLQLNVVGKVVAVNDSIPSFLQYVDKLGLGIGDAIEVIHKEEFDQLLTIRIKGEERIVSDKFAENIFVVCEACQPGRKCATTECAFK